jgi:Protein of unknown function (DUF2782)
MRACCVILLFVFCTAAFAQQSKRMPKLEPLAEPPPPPAMSETDEPAVNIPVPKTHQIEEMREGGRVVALRVTPPGGKPYFLIDTTGNGNWMRRDSLDDGVRVPQWPIKQWD